MQEPLREKVFVKALPETIIRLSEETPDYIMGLSTDNLRVYVCVILVGKTKRISLLQASFNTDIQHYIREEMKWLNGINDIYIIRNTNYEAFYLGDAQQCEDHNHVFFTQLNEALAENQINIKPIHVYTNTGVCTVSRDAEICTVFSDKFPPVLNIPSSTFLTAMIEVDHLWGYPSENNLTFLSPAFLLFDSKKIIYNYQLTAGAQLIIQLMKKKFDEIGDVRNVLALAGKLLVDLRLEGKHFGLNHRYMAGMESKELMDYVTIHKQMLIQKLAARAEKIVIIWLDQIKKLDLLKSPGKTILEPIAIPTIECQTSATNKEKHEKRTGFVHESAENLMNIYKQFGVEFLPTNIKGNSSLEDVTLNEVMLSNASHAAEKRIARARTKQEKTEHKSGNLSSKHMNKYLEVFCHALVSASFYSTNDADFILQLNIANHALYELGKYIIHEISIMYDIYIRTMDELILTPLFGLLEQIFQKNEKLSADVNTVINRIISMTIVIDNILNIRYQKIINNDRQGFLAHLLSNNINMNVKRYGSDVAPDLIYIAKYQISGSIDTAKTPNKEFDFDNPYHGKSVLMNGQALVLATLRSQLKIDPKKALLQSQHNYALWLLLLHRGRLSANNNNFVDAFKDFEEANNHTISLKKYGIILPSLYLSECRLITRLQQLQHGEINSHSNQNLSVIFKEADNLIQHISYERLLWPLGERLMLALDRCGKWSFQNQNHYLAGQFFSYALKICNKLLTFKLEQYIGLKTVLTKFTEKCGANNLLALKKVITESAQNIKSVETKANIIFKCENKADLRLLSSILREKNIVFMRDKSTREVTLLNEEIIDPIALEKVLKKFIRARRDPSTVYLPLEDVEYINKSKTMVTVETPIVDAKAEKLQRHLESEIKRNQTIEKAVTNKLENVSSIKPVIPAPIRINLGPEFPEYNSEDKDCPIKLLSGRHVHHQSYLGIFGDKLFSQFKSVQDYEKFKKIYDEGIIKTDKGQRGIIYCKGKGTSSFFKIKSPDTGVRVYGDLRKTITDQNTGKTIHVVEFNRVKNKHT